MNQSIFDRYTKNVGTRFYRFQKHKFENALTKDMEEAGYEKTVFEGKKMLVMKAEDYFYGNLKRMKTVIVVPYDTPERKFWHKVLYFPFDGTKTMNKTFAATYMPIILLYIAILLVVYATGKLITSPKVASMISLLMFLFVFFLVYFMLHGFANHKNVNRNSSAIVAAVQLAKQLNKDERQRVAFLFTDKNKGSYLGAKIANDRFEKEGKNPNIICLDCIGTGPVTKVSFNPGNRRFAVEVANEYKEKIETVKVDDMMRIQTPMINFRKAIMIASGEVDENNRLYVLGTGTRKDKVADAKHIDEITDMLYSYVQKQK